MIRQVAVTVCKGTAYNGEIYILKVENDGFSCTRTIRLDVGCEGIEHFRGHLYVGYSQGLNIFTTEGKFVKKLYTGSVLRLAISKGGKNIYVVNGYITNSLVTLDDHGNAHSTLQDEELVVPTSIAAADDGSVFVCGRKSCSIIQVDKDGKKKLTTLATVENGIVSPDALFFDGTTSELLVGQAEDSLLVMKIK